MKPLIPLYITLIVFSLACSPPTRVINTDGESNVLASDNQTCLTSDCDVNNFDPIIDYTDNIPSEDSDNIEDIDESLSETEALIETVCDGNLDQDGDGVTCDCDQDDTNASIYRPLIECDADSDRIPAAYDLCRRHRDTQIDVIHLCDDDVEFEDQDLVVFVEYDDTQWTELYCQSTAKKYVNFAVAYVYRDQNLNQKADACEITIQVNPFAPYFPNSLP